MALTAGWDLDRASLHLPHTSVGAEVITGPFLSMSLMKSLVILSSSSTSLIERGTPPGGAPAPGVTLGADGLPIGLLYDEMGDEAGLGCGAAGGDGFHFSWLTAGVGFE